MIKPVLLCNNKRLEELNNKIYKRNITYAPIPVHESFRSVPTRQVHMPILDYKKSNTERLMKKEFNVNTMYTPADSLHTQSYRNNIDTETLLRGTMLPLQKCDKKEFVPNSRSDLYNSDYLTQQTNNTEMTSKLLFKNEVFDDFNPNKCNLGYKLFNNHTRIQLRDL